MLDPCNAASGKKVISCKFTQCMVVFEFVFTRVLRCETDPILLVRKFSFQRCKNIQSFGKGYTEIPNRLSRLQANTRQRVQFASILDDL